MGICTTLGMQGFEVKKISHRDYVFLLQVPVGD
jgi:hypothetical protein